MPTAVQPAVAPAVRPAPRAASVPLFAAALFLSALLLFAVQPMFTKMVLPVLGGSPAVWSIALVFFQALLLAGYCYAHLLARYASTGAALALHLGLMLGAALSLPIAIPAGWTSAPADGEAFWLLGLFAVSVGLPFFALAANGPLLQAWFSRSGHPRAADPYFLYAASNVGSFAALVAYPLAVEPLFRMQEQTAGWFMGFVALAVLIGGCGLLGGARWPPRATAPDEGATAATAPARWRERAGWVGLAFVPSGLLVAVTAHISTDIAAAPLLWVVPLALFPVTFVLAFRDKALAAPAMLARLQVWGTALALMTAIASVPLSLGLALHLALFFVNAMLCHGALYRRRPAAARLTEFYVCMSLGGVLGGIACALLAPQLFSRVLEYPMLLVAALFCRPGFFGADARAWLKEAGRAALICMIVVAAVAAAAGALLPADSIGFVLMAILAVLMMVAWRTPPQVAPTALAALIVAVVAGGLNGESVRSFFGVHKLTRTGDGRFLTLSHGTTIHGAIRIANDDGTAVAGRPEPTTYYTYEGAIGSAIASVRQARGGRLGSVAAIGLGAGSLACHIAAGETWSFFEIDRAVLRIASDPGRFRFLSECAPDVPVRLGDARITLAGEPGGKALIVLDAFSSDAIPAHLLTREAIGLYLSKLDRDGVLVVNISNRHLDLTRILARAAAEHGLATHVMRETADEPTERRFRARAIVAALARDPAHLGAIAQDPAWQRVVPDMARRPWTDDFSDILQAILDRQRS
ncbi:MAG: fused MFS/spermidine synthase [Microvirga sp.]